MSDTFIPALSFLALSQLQGGVDTNAFLLVWDKQSHMSDKNSVQLGRVATDCFFKVDLNS